MAGALSNARWIALIQAVKIGSQLANLFVLSRLLGPQDYGLMALAGVATQLALILRDMGTAALIIQKPDLDADDLDAVFGLNLSLGLLLALALMAGAPWLAGWLAEPRLTPVLLALAPTFLIGAGGAAHQALLERGSRFREVAAVESVAALGALVVALGLAFSGAGVWSLVAQAVTLSAVGSAGMVWRSGWRPRRVRPRLQALRGAAGFSAPMAGYQLTSYLFRNADTLMAGRWLGTAATGVYALALRVMLFPVQNISWVATRALFPVMSRMQHDTPALAALHLRSLRGLAFITMPLMVGLAMLAEPFVALVFAAQWQGLAGLLQPLALVGLLQVISGTTGPVFMARGRSRLLFGLAIVHSSVHLAAYALGLAHGGLEGLAWAYLAASALMTPPTLLLCARELGLAALTPLRALLPACSGGLLIAGAVAVCRQLLPGGAEATLLLGTGALAAALSYLLHAGLVQRHALADLRAALRRS